jgi:dTDP-glucose 4,6-dehydratase
MFKLMYVIITGVAGFIGSNFLYYFLKQHPDSSVIGIDSLTYAGNMENLSLLTEDQKKDFTFFKSDIADYDKINSIFNDFQIDFVINFAAESHVDRSIHDPQIFLKTNVLGTQNLLHVAKEHWITPKQNSKNKKFLQVSTDEVYGSLGSTGFFTESSPLDPHSPYSASKASADLITKAYFDTYGLPINITRCSNNYGPYQFPEKLIPLIIRNCLSHKSLPVYGDGLNIRDWLYVDDHCSAIDMVLFKGKNGETYNIGGNNEITNIDLVKKIIHILSRKTNDKLISENLIKFVPDRLGHDRRYAIDFSKIKSELNWLPKLKIEEGIEITVQWYLDSISWLESVVSGEYLSFYEKNYN